MVPESGADSPRAPKMVFVGIFIHTYEWGHQIRGDERGYIEKVRAYAGEGVGFYTLERYPSIQDDMGVRVYTSLKLARCPIPPQSLIQLVQLSLFALRAAARRYPSRPAAVYAYNQDVENLWVGYLLKILLGARLVVVYHHLRAASFSRFRIGVADRVRRGFNPVMALSKSLIPALNLFAARHADVHIALTAATRDDVARIIGVDDCAVVGNGLDTEKFRPLIINKEFDCAFLGRLAPQKGVDVLLHAWKEVVQAEPRARLVLIGGGEENDVARYVKMTSDLGLRESVKFTGFVGDDELVRLLGESKMFVFPSRKEGFAQAVSQAMGCGLCCVLSDIPPLREVYGGAAEFVPVEQPHALSQSILRLLRDEDERTDLGSRARRLAEGFSWKAAVAAELGVILGEKSSRERVPAVEIHL